MAVYVENIVTQNAKLNCGLRMFDYNIVVIIIFSYQSNIVRNPEIKYMINLIISAFIQEAQIIAKFHFIFYESTLEHK